MGIASLDGLVARVPLLWRTLLAILILCGALLSLVESRASILRKGAEIRLKTAPVDPRDLFRGDYVVLGYEIGAIELAAVTGDREFRRGETIFVQLRPDAEGFARVVAVFRERPAVAPPDLVIAGKVRSATPGRLTVSYGLESYFVPQGSGRAIERTERARIEVVAAVSGSGDAAIKRLLIDGKLVHAEPPY